MVTDEMQLDIADNVPNSQWKDEKVNGPHVASGLMRHP